MTQKNKIIAAWIAFCFVVIHVSFILIYAAPPQLVPDKAKSFVSPYVNPLFHQTWAMFAPCPVVEGRLKVQLNSTTDKSEWFYPTASDRTIHNWVRVSHHAELVLLESNLIYWVNYDMQLNELKIGDQLHPNQISPFKGGHSYRMINRYVHRLASQLEGEPVSANVVVELSNVKTGEEGELNYPEFNWK